MWAYPNFNNTKDREQFLALCFLEPIVELVGVAFQFRMSLLIIFSDVGSCSWKKFQSCLVVAAWISLGGQSDKTVALVV